MIENTKIDQEISIDEKIEIIFRAIHSKIMMLYQEYHSMHSLLSDEKSTIETINKFHSTIDGLKVSLRQEFELITYVMKDSDKQPIKQVSDNILGLIKEIKEWMSEYNDRLIDFKKFIEMENTEKIREHIDTEYAQLTRLYNKIFNEDNEIIRDLKILKTAA